MQNLWDMLYHISKRQKDVDMNNKEESEAKANNQRSALTTISIFRLHITYQSFQNWTLSNFCGTYGIISLYRQEDVDMSSKKESETRQTTRFCSTTLAISICFRTVH